MFALPSPLAVLLLLPFTGLLVMLMFTGGGGVGCCTLRTTVVSAASSSLLAVVAGAVDVSVGVASVGARAAGTVAVEQRELEGT